MCSSHYAGIEPSRVIVVREKKKDCALEVSVWAGGVRNEAVTGRCFGCSVGKGREGKGPDGREMCGDV